MKIRKRFFEAWVVAWAGVGENLITILTLGRVHMWWSFKLLCWYVYREIERGK